MEKRIEKKLDKLLKQLGNVNYMIGTPDKFKKVKKEILNLCAEIKTKKNK